MNSFNRILLVSLFIQSLFLTALNLHAQSLKKLVKEADKAFADQEYATAALYYRKAMNKDSSVIEINYNYAEASRMMLEYNIAHKWYGFVFKKDRGKKFPLASFWYASMSKNLGKYKEAKQNFEKYYKKNYSRKKDDYYTKKAFHEMSACDYAVLLKNQANPIAIQHPDSSVNSVYAEFRPVQYDSVLYFSSIRPSDNTNDAVFKSRVYQSVLRNKKWTENEALALENNISNLVFSSDKKKAYFTICEYKKSSSISCEIYSGTFEDQEIHSIEKMGETVNEPLSNNTQPFIADFKGKESVLYFSSDRKGGFGKMDLWAVKINAKGEEEKAYNLGPEINTMDDELSPFYDVKTSTLYFSSDWHKGMGGFDIFKTSKDSTGKKWKQAVNIGAPVNSGYNELYYTFNNKLNNGFFVSNRPGSYTRKQATCCNDIYYYHIDTKDTSTQSGELNSEIKTDASKEIQLLVPITLYFHNDEPDPRNRNIRTNLNYITTFRNYLGMKKIYKKEYSTGLKGEKIKEAEEDIEEFFAEHVEKGEEDLEKFSNLMVKILNEGRDIHITIKGYCSPLASTDYNVNLAKRRLSSLINYFNEFQNGILKPYLNSLNPNEPRIEIKEEDIGELEASPFVSDNPNDIRNSIYSKSAALERKIQIIAVSSGERKLKKP